MGLAIEKSQFVSVNSVAVGFAQGIEVGGTFHMPVPGFKKIQIPKSFLGLIA